MLRLTILAVSLMAICAMSIDEEFDFPEVITFEYGKRVAGDRLVEKFQTNYTFDSPRGLSWGRSYNAENDENQASVTFARVVVEQDNRRASSRIALGGIGKRYMTIFIESEEILYFRGVMEFYGQ